MKIHEFIIFTAFISGFIALMLYGLDREAQRQQCLIYDKELGRTFYNYESPDCLALTE